MKSICLKSIPKVVMVLFLFGIPGAFADVYRPTGDGYWYYSIGGGDPFVYYRQSNKTTLNLSVGADWNLMRGCSFDPSFGISETFSDMKNNIYGIAEDVIDSAVAVAAGWALSKVRENWPGQYDTIMNGLKDAKESYTLSLKTCRDAKADIRSGRNPVDGWFSVTRKSSWDKASVNGENPVASEQEIEESSGNNGVVWVDGVKHGGTGQPPIRAVEDTVRAGYEHLVGSEVSGDEDSVTGDPNITRVFSNATAAATWTQSVVGEREVRLCTGCPKLRTKVGQGLRYQYRVERDKANLQLSNILKKANISVSDLNTISVPGMGVVINDTTVRHLQQAPIDERMILANRLAGEIALARTMEKALIARDLINTGAQEPNVSAVGDVAQSEINYSRERLQEEIDNILFETEVRKKVLTNAAGTIAQRGAARNRDAGFMDYVRIRPQSNGMSEGAINDE
jgi:integrating conjugative element protein (TIGR03755 family)